MFASTVYLRSFGAASSKKDKEAKATMSFQFANAFLCSSQSTAILLAVSNLHAQLLMRSAHLRPQWLATNDGATYADNQHADNIKGLPTPNVELQCS
eukprot:2476383-Amphidinium_carterae.1